MYSLSTIGFAQVKQEWVARGGNAVALDREGNIYVAGLSRGIGTLLDFATIKTVFAAR